jgi:glycosyltransferase involved in cell wall biosynthesis
MKALLVHLSDGHKGGGGGIAMQRLHFGLREAGIDSHILCRTKTMDSPHVTQIPRMPRIEYRLKKLSSRLGLNDIHLISSYRVRREKAYRNTDVLDFQGIHTQTLSYLALPSLTRDKPAIFTMHDMWALTGHCIYSYDCQRWKTGCGECPYPDTHPAISHDNTHVEWRLKKWAYAHSDLTFVAPSTWLVDLAKQSMVAHLPIHHIPYGLDTEIYHPADPDKCRAELGIPPRVTRGSPAGGEVRPKVLMFAALKLDGYRKGGDLLLETLHGLPASLKAETILLTIGQGGNAIGEAAGDAGERTAFAGMQTIHLGYVSEEHLKVAAYSAADLFLCPTRADNLPLVLLESMACGTPMVAFDVGGVRDLVRPGITGYLAKPESVTDFGRGIVQLLADTACPPDKQRPQDEPPLARMRKQSREIAVQEYRLELQVQRYIELYHQLADNSNGRSLSGDSGSAQGR